MSPAGEGHHETEKPHGGDHHHGQHHDESTIMPFYTPPKQRQRWGDEQLPVHNNWGDIFFDLFYVALACECMDLSLGSGEERIFAFDGRMMCLTRPTLVALSLSLTWNRQPRQSLAGRSDLARLIVCVRLFPSNYRPLAYENVLGRPLLCTGRYLSPSLRGTDPHRAGDGRPLRPTHFRPFQFEGQCRHV